MKQTSEDEIARAVKQVVDAWVIEGRAPDYHRKQKDRLYREWQPLAVAVERLVKAARQQRNPD